MEPDRQASSECASHDRMLMKLLGTHPQTTSVYGLRASRLSFINVSINGGGVLFIPASYCARKRQ